MQPFAAGERFDECQRLGGVPALMFNRIKGVVFMHPSIVKFVGRGTCTGFLVLILAVPAGAAGFSETERFSSNSLTVTNLIGEVRIAGHDGSDFEVVVEVQGGDASRDNVRVKTTGSSLIVEFPDSKRFVYPKLGRGNVSFRPNANDGWLDALLGRGEVKVSGSGTGMEVWADLEIRVPDGGRLKLRQGAGEVVAENVDGDLDLDSHWGKVSVESVDGNLIVDTGSGHVDVAGVRGDVAIDTGSGHVDISGVQAEELSVDTGSGRVTLADVSTSGDVYVDTGSGDISLTNVSGDAFKLDTGSGDVNGVGIRAESAVIDTGSGAVELSLTEMGSGDFEIDTGSGRITLGLPTDVSASVYADAGSGGVTVDVDGARDMRRDDDEVFFKIGGGDARVTLDTGSGAIRIVDSN